MLPTTPDGQSGSPWGPDCNTVAAQPSSTRASRAHLRPSADSAARRSRSADTSPPGPAASGRRASITATSLDSSSRIIVVDPDVLALARRAALELNGPSRWPGIPQHCDLLGTGVGGGPGQVIQDRAPLGLDGGHLTHVTAPRGSGPVGGGRRPAGRSSQPAPRWRV